MGPKKGKIMAKNHIGITTGSLANARRQMLFVSCMPITFSHTKYRGVHANPNVINCAFNAGYTSKWTRSIDLSYEGMNMSSLEKRRVRE